MQSLDDDVPYNKCADVRPASVYNYISLDVNTLCPERLVLRVLPICIILQCDATVGNRLD